MARMLTVIAAALAVGSSVQANASPTSLVILARPSQFKFVGTRQPSAGEVRASSALAAARQARIMHTLPHHYSGGAPNTVQDLIIQANDGEKPYEQTFGAGTTVIDQGSFPDESAFEFNSDSIYPGAIVQGKAQFITAGQLVTNPLTAGPGTLTLDAAPLAPQATTSVHVPTANKAALSQALNTLLNQPLHADASAAFNCIFQTVNSSADASYDAGLSFGYGSVVSVSNTFQSADSKSSSHVLVSCTEAFVTASYLPDPRSDVIGDAAFFDPGLTVSTASQYIAPGNPPLFVESVTYGAELFLLADSTTSSDQLTDALKAAFSYAGYSAKASFTDTQKSTLQNTTVHILALGGRASAMAHLIPAITGANVADGLVQYLQGTIGIAASANQVQEEGAPIDYKLAYLDFTPIAETATIYGVTKQVTDAMLTGASIQFQQNGNGKGKDTLVDIAIEDGNGRAIARTQIGPNTVWGDHYKTPVINLPIVAQGSESALTSGNLHLLTHPAKHDVWKFTAYVNAKYNDGTTSFGQFTDELSSAKSVTVTVPDPTTPQGVKTVTHSGQDLLVPLASFLH